MHGPTDNVCANGCKKKKETANAANYTDGVAKGPIVL